MEFFPFFFFHKYLYNRCPPGPPFIETPPLSQQYTRLPHTAHPTLPPASQRALGNDGWLLLTAFLQRM